MRHLTTLSLVLLLASSLFSQEISLEDRLVARYLFNGNANNEVENLNHGLPENITWAADRYNQTASCAEFNGSNGRIIIPHTEDLNWNAQSESYSIAFWVNSPDPMDNDAGSRRVLYKWEGEIAVGYPFAFHTANKQRLTANIYDSQNGNSLVYNNPWDAQWQHITMVWDHESETLSIYQNGKLIDTNQTHFNSSTKNQVPIRIGFTILNDDDQGYYKGLLDDLYFYNRALNACEIEALHSDQLLYQR